MLLASFKWPTTLPSTCLQDLYNATSRVHLSLGAQLPILIAFNSYMCIEAFATKDNPLGYGVCYFQVKCMGICCFYNKQLVSLYKL